MGVDYYSGVIMGVRLSDIGFKIEQTSNRYEVHDKKGNPTGKFETEDKYKISFRNEEKILDEIYNEEIETICNIKSPLTYHNNNEYDSDFDIDEVVIGISLATGGDDEWCSLKEVDISKKIELIRNEIFKQFGINIEPKLYFYSYVSC